MEMQKCFKLHENVLQNQFMNTSEINELAAATTIASLKSNDPTSISTADPKSISSTLQDDKSRIIMAMDNNENILHYLFWSIVNEKDTTNYEDKPSSEYVHAIRAYAVNLLNYFRQTVKRSQADIKEKSNDDFHASLLWLGHTLGSGLSPSSYTTDWIIPEQGKVHEINTVMIYFIVQ